MGSFTSGRGSPGTAQPVHQLGRFLVGHALPPDIPFWRHGAVGEDGIFRDAKDGVGIRFHAGAGRHAKEASLRVDRIEPPIGTELHPGNVVADGLHFPPRNGGDEHGQVRLAACRGEGTRYVLELAGGADQLKDEHVLGHPALIACLNGSDAQGVALLA